MKDFTVASWNVNSIRTRLEHVLRFLEQTPVDVLALQETKTPDDTFPQHFAELGYHVELSGQKSYNGVALISRHPINIIRHGFDGYDDPQKRIIMADVGPIRLLNLYIPNGSSVGSEKYDYKLAWLAHAKSCIKANQSKPLVVVGDFNIAPTDLDVHDPIKWSDGILVSPEERQWFQEITDMGMIDTFRDCHPDAQTFSWWDYRGGSFRRNHGLRIDFIMAHPSLSWRDSWIDAHTRAEEQPSDHAPVITTFVTK